MGETVKFTSNGDEVEGYLAVSGSGSGPGVMVVQEWWGLVPQIKRCCDRLAGEGFTTLAPDLYRGEIAQHTEMDKANQLMTSLPHDRAARDMAGAIDYLLGNNATTGDKVGVVGFCMGGLLALTIAAQQGARMGAAVAFYGAPYGDSAPDWSGLEAPVLLHIAESDDFFPPDALVPLCEALSATGKDVSYHVYEGTGHAFANEENALGTHDEEAAATAWDRTLNFLHTNLG